MESEKSQKEFSPDELFEEEFDIVPAGQGNKKPVSPNSVIWQFVTIVLCSTLAFFIGRLNFLSGQKPPIRIEQQASVANVEIKNTEVPATVATPKPVVKTLAPPATVPAPSTNKNIPGGYVASKSGTRYYLPWCGTVSRIKEENKIWFATKAEKAGYTPAANCPGI